MARLGLTPQVSMDLFPGKPASGASVNEAAKANVIMLQAFVS